jgi:Tol biopolymer transport system component
VVHKSRFGMAETIAVAVAVSVVLYVGFVLGSAIRDLGELSDFGEGWGEVFGPWAFEPAWAPDGTQLAFVLRGYSIVGYSLTDVCTISANGSKGRRIAYGDMFSEVGEPAWSPDGVIAYVNSFPQATIYTAGYDGQALVTGESPAWSPDGSRLAFVTQGELILANTDGSQPKSLAHGDHPAWSPDGSRIAFDYAGQVRIVNVDGSDEKALAPGAEPTWAPEGRRVALVRGSTIYVVEVDSLAERPLLEGSHPAWSPVADRIAFDRGTDIYFVDSDGKHEVRFVDGPEYGPCTPSGD